MCSPTPCSTCGKITWQGCGQHVDEVMSQVPDAQRCRCDRVSSAPFAPSGLLRWLGGDGK